MGLFGSSARRAMRPEDVIGSLDLRRERDAARALGIGDGRRAARPVDGVRDAGASDATHRRTGFYLASILAERLFKPRRPRRPAWAERPGDVSAYPPEWEQALRRFVDAFRSQEARERAALTALGLPVPAQAGELSIEPVGVEAWIRYLGQYRFSSLDVTPPTFELPPQTDPDARPSPNLGAGRRARGRDAFGLARPADGLPVAGAGGEPGPRGAEGRERPGGPDSPRRGRDPYALYRLLNGSGYVYHLFEGGLGADFEDYWHRKRESLANGRTARW